MAAWGGVKVLMLLEKEFPPDIRVEHEVEALQEAGHEVLVVCLTRKKGSFWSSWRNSQVYHQHISWFRAKTSVGCLRFPFYFSFWRKVLRELLEQHDFHVVHVHDLPLARIGAELKARCGMKFILDLHENWPALLEVSPHVQTPLGKALSSVSQWRRYEREMVLRADCVIAVVEEAAERIQPMLANGPKVQVVSNTPDLKELQVNGRLPAGASDQMLLFYGGEVSRIRGLQLVIRALSGLPDLRISLRIAGQGKYLEQLRRIAADCGVEKQVDFLGWIPLPDLMQHMQVSDVLLIPHLKSELTDSTVPHKLFQYMYTAKPILASNCRPIQRIIESTGSGLIYEHDNVEDLKQKIVYLYRRWLRGGLGSTRGRRCVDDGLNWNRDKQSLLNLYESLETENANCRR